MDLDVIHQSVVARTQEIGIRMTLGGNAASVSRMVLTAGLAPAVAGLGLGLIGSIVLSRTMTTYLYETSALDPLIYMGVTVLLLVTTRSPAWRRHGAPPGSIR